MKKTKKIIKGIGAFARKPALINLLINENEAWKKRFKSKQKKYNEFSTITLESLSNPFQEEVETCFLGLK